MGRMASRLMSRLAREERINKKKKLGRQHRVTVLDLAMCWSCTVPAVKLILLFC